MNPPMAKSARKHKEQGASTGPKAVPGCLLELAFVRYQAGDMVAARKVAKQLLAAPATPADEAAVKKLAPQLIAPPELVAGQAPPEPGPPPTAHDLAKELVLRTRVPGKAFLFAGVSLLLWLSLLALALTRA